MRRINPKFFYLLLTIGVGAWMPTHADVNSVNAGRQVQDTINKSAHRQFTDDINSGIPSQILIAPSSSISNDAPTEMQMPEVFSLPKAPDTNYVPPPGAGGGTGPSGGGGSTNPSLDLSGGKPNNSPVRVCASGWVDSMNRPVVGVSAGDNFQWTANTLQPSFAGYGGLLAQGAFTADPQRVSKTFNWVGGQNYLDTLIDNYGSNTFAGSIQINSSQTTKWLMSGPNGNCKTLFDACRAAAGTTQTGPDTVSTKAAEIGGTSCIDYYTACQPVNLMAAPGNATMTSPSDAQGTTTGGCQTFSTAPTCSQVLPLFQKYAPKFSCTCSTNSSASPTCTVYCTNIVDGWQMDVGPTMNCSCASSTAVGAPTCVQNCLGQLPGVQQAKGTGYTCSCPSGNSSVSAPVCQQNCGGLLPSFQAKYPGYSCTCPTGKAVVANPVCVPTCDALRQSKQASLGSNYTCSCQNPQSTTEQPSCPMNCGGLMATNSLYQSNSNQFCSCPSGNQSVTTPTCVPTCGSKLATFSCPKGQVASCPNGNSNPGTPVCQQQACGSLQSTWSCPTNQVATCPNGTSYLGNPVCAQTCGSQKASLKCPTGQTPSCPNGDSNPGTPTCQQQSCGSLLSTWSCQSGYAATCPNGTSYLGNPVCSQTCGSKKASLSCPTGQIPSCPNGDSALTAPVCQQQSCGSLLSTWSCQSGYTATCPNGSSYLGNPVCTQTCGSRKASLSCPTGQRPYCPSGDSSLTAPVCQQQSCGSLLSTWSCPTNQIATCPNGSSYLGNPVCAQTCGSKKASLSCPAGQRPYCPSGDNSLTSPICQQQTCGSLQPTWSCQSGYTATCPNGTSYLGNPTCVCGQSTSGYYQINWRNYSGNQSGYGLWFVGTTGFITANMWQNLWVGEFVGSGWLSGSSVSGNFDAGGAYNFSGSLNSSGGSGTYAAASGSTSDTSGTWSATKIANITSSCNTSTTCGNVYNAVNPTMSSYGQYCACLGGTGSTSMPACRYSSCSGQNVPSGSWTFTSSNGTTCAVNVTSSYAASNLFPSLNISGNCSGGESLSGAVACDSTVGQNIKPGVTGIKLTASYGNYIIGGTFSGWSFSGSVQGTTVTVSGSKN
jgi:hypothetical protein